MLLWLVSACAVSMAGQRRWQLPQRRSSKWASLGAGVTLVISAVASYDYLYRALPRRRRPDRICSSGHFLVEKREGWRRGREWNDLTAGLRDMYIVSNVFQILYISTCRKSPLLDRQWSVPSPWARPARRILAVSLHPGRLAGDDDVRHSIAVRTSQTELTTVIPLTDLATARPDRSTSQFPSLRCRSRSKDPSFARASHLHSQLQLLRPFALQIRGC